MPWKDLAFGKHKSMFCLSLDLASQHVFWPDWSSVGPLEQYRTEGRGKWMLNGILSLCKQLAATTSSFHSINYDAEQIESPRAVTHCLGWKIFNGLTIVRIFSQPVLHFNAFFPKSFAIHFLVLYGPLCLDFWPSAKGFLSHLRPRKDISLPHWSPHSLEYHLTCQLLKRGVGHISVKGDNVF